MQTKVVQCAFAQRSIQYLGHVISCDGVAIDPEKISAISSWPTHVSIKELTLQEKVVLTMGYVVIKSRYVVVKSF